MRNLKIFKKGNVTLGYVFSVWLFFIEVKCTYDRNKYYLRKPTANH